MFSLLFKLTILCVISRPVWQTTDTACKSVGILPTLRHREKALLFPIRDTTAVCWKMGRCNLSPASIVGYLSPSTAVKPLFSLRLSRTSSANNPSRYFKTLTYEEARKIVLGSDRGSTSQKGLIKPVALYISSFCPYCDKVLKSFMKSNGRLSIGKVTVKDIRDSETYAATCVFDELTSKTGKQRVPVLELENQYLLYESDCIIKLLKAYLEPNWHT